MKRMILSAVVAFTLGAVSSPRAANENETLSLLCARWKSVGGDKLADKLQADRVADFEFIKDKARSNPDVVLSRAGAVTAARDLEILDVMKRTFCGK
jgi:hypothetical protein